MSIGLMHNGANNGSIAVSSRELGMRIGVHYTTAASAIQELINAGFLRRTKSSDFGRKRRAAEYVLTHLRNVITDEPATRDYVRSRAAPSINQ
jgi:DNA-binding transcriptional regulator YhcF (GntR family)